MSYVQENRYVARVQLFFLYLGFTASILSSSVHAAFNKLNWVEVAHNTTGMQIMFDFAEPVYVKKKLDETKQELHLTFPGMDLKHFNSSQLLTHINKLKASGMITNILVKQKTKPISRVSVILCFGNEKEKIKSPLHQRLLIKWSKMEDPNRLILDIFKLEALEKLDQQHSLILQAHRTEKQNNEHSACLSKKKIRIVLDPGHGGAETGSVSANKLKEKDVALAIARRAAKMLKQDNYSVFLTRNEDTTMSLLERSEFAEQLKADIFVSIHANASPTPQPETFGIETLTLSEQQVHPETEQRGFFFLNEQSNKRYFTLLDTQTKNRISFSETLAHTIQHSLINYLEEQHLPTKNRGIKKRHCRVLLRNRMPSALVEVGFLTHEQEAKRLTCSRYHQLLAEGICQGIKKFISSGNSIKKVHNFF